MSSVSISDIDTISIHTLGRTWTFVSETRATFAALLGLVAKSTVARKCEKWTNV
jgi:hypothetical protein